MKMLLATLAAVEHTIQKVPHMEARKRSRSASRNPIRPINNEESSLRMIFVIVKAFSNGIVLGKPSMEFRRSYQCLQRGNVSADALKTCHACFINR